LLLIANKTDKIIRLLLPIKYIKFEIIKYTSPFCSLFIATARHCCLPQESAVFNNSYYQSWIGLNCVLYMYESAIVSKERRSQLRSTRPSAICRVHAATSLLRSHLTRYLAGWLFSRFLPGKQADVRKYLPGSGPCVGASLGALIHVVHHVVRVVAARLPSLGQLSGQVLHTAALGQWVHRMDIRGRHTRSSTCNQGLAIGA